LRRFSSLKKLPDLSTALLLPQRQFLSKAGVIPRWETTFPDPQGDVIGKDQCKKLQNYIMSMETAKNLGGLFELTTAR
jgi:hypothetical protein